MESTKKPLIQFYARTREGGGECKSSGGFDHGTDMGWHLGTSTIQSIYLPQLHERRN